MLRKSRIVVQTAPWHSKTEFEEVYRCLFSRNIFDMRWAVDRVTMWESRCHPVLDIGIDATAAIVRAMIQDQLFETNTSLCQPPDLQLMYSVALIRFVNVVSEIARSQGSTVPVRVAALKLGIPEWIVHLRNDASHSRLPSLDVLRKGSWIALDWLEANYWNEEIMMFSDYINMSDVTDSKPFTTKANEVIAEYLHCQYDRLWKRVPPYVMPNKKFNNVLNILRSLLRTQPRSLFTELLRPGFFLPSVQDLDEILGLNNETSFIEEKTIDLPSALKTFWLPVVKLIMEENCLQEFVELLLQDQNKRDPLHQKVAGCWVHTLITNADGESLFGDDFETEMPSFNWIRLLGTSLEHCCIYTPALLPIIADKINPPLSAEKKSFIMAFVAVYLGATTSSNSINKRSSKSSKTFDVDAMKEDLKLRDSERTEENIFHEAPENVGWTSVPLGYVFGSEEDASFTINVPPLPDCEGMDASVPNENVVESEKQCLDLKEESRPTSNEQNEIVENGNIGRLPLEYHPERVLIYRPTVGSP